MLVANDPWEQEMLLLPEQRGVFLWPYVVLATHPYSIVSITSGIGMCTLRVDEAVVILCGSRLSRL